MHAIFEIVGARLGAPPQVPFATFLADSLGNAYTVVAPGSPVNVLPQRPLLLRQGEHCAEGLHPQLDPLAPLVAYANQQADALGGLRRGQVIITGSFTGAIPIGTDTNFRGVFDGLSPVDVTFVAREQD